VSCGEIIMRKTAQNRSIVLFLMLSILLIQLTGTFMSQDVYADEKTIILFDQVHLQFYTSERMQSAITSLNNTEDFIVYFNDQRFTETSLLGVDILVIENPERSFTFQERLVLVEYLDNGGNIFLLADPRGTISNLNNIIDAIQYTDGRFAQHVIFKSLIKIISPHKSVFLVKTCEKVAHSQTVSKKLLHIQFRSKITILTQ